MESSDVSALKMKDTRACSRIGNELFIIVIIR
jgi:hypothetical protein